MSPKALFFVLVLTGIECVLVAAANGNAKSLVEKKRIDAEIDTILFGKTPRIHQCLKTNATFKPKPRIYENEPHWTVVILKEEIFKNKTLNIQHCSGSLIHPQVVLTAAHCVFEKSFKNLKVRAGECDKVKYMNSAHHQERHIKSVELLTAYNDTNPKRDIALLFLQKPFNISSHVQTACLPSTDVHLDVDYVRCFVTGWERKSHILPGYANFRKLDTTVVPSQKCEKVLRLTGLGPDFVLDNSSICASGVLNKAALDTNGGAPLVCPLCRAKGQMIQIGVMSWGFNSHPLPDVFTSIANAHDWITKKLEEKGLTLPACGISWKSKNSILMRTGLVVKYK